MTFETLKIKDVKEELGQAVKLIRKRNKISQSELADLLDLSRVTIQNLESGKNFTIDTLLKVLQQFDLLSQLNDGIQSLVQKHEEVESLY
ncbi:MAG: helix-turn-helix transcriptional regulator [Bacteroidota bacterium]